MVKVLNEQNFDETVLKSELPVLVDFYADWCGPCKMMAPVVEQIAQETEGSAVVCKINVDQSMAIAQRYQVMNIPTFLVFKNGVMTERVVGGVPKDILIDKL